MADMEEDFVTPDVMLSDDDVGDVAPVTSSDDRSHSILLNAISAMDGKKKLKQLQRSEPSREISEFSMTSQQNKVGVHELMRALGAQKDKRELKKQLNKVIGKQTLPAPLPRFQKQKIERTVAYQETSKEVSKWQPVVQENRRADQLKFPLEQPSTKLITTSEAVKRFQPHTPMEKEIAQLLHGSKNVLSNDRMLTKAEERALRAMDLEEARERRAELQKYRALLSYQEAKHSRQGKIKSKKYRKIQRKEREKKEKKVMEEMEKNDPEGYTEKLLQVEKSRIQERMSLKHRGGSKKMKKEMLYGKYDEGVRQAVQDMIQKSKELREKTVAMESDSDAGSDVTDLHDDAGELMDVALATTASGHSNNPWMLPPTVKKINKFSRPQEVVNKVTEENTSDSETFGDVPENVGITNKKSDELDIDELFEEIQEKRKSLNIESLGDSNVVKSKKIKRKRKNSRKGQKMAAAETDSESEAEENVKNSKEKKRKKNENKTGVKSEEKTKEYDSENGEEEGLIQGSLTRKRTYEELEGEWSEDESEQAKAKSKRSAVSSVNGAQAEGRESSRQEARIDPSKVVTMETSMRSSITPDVISDGDDTDGEEDHDTRQRMTIAQAFADDDVIDEFAAEKRDVEKRDKIGDVDLTLPGWGEWHGEGLKPSRRKRSRFTIKAPDAPPRKDRNMDNVIISETKDNSIAKHQVSNLPFPFKSVHQFESSVRAPLGSTWNPETAVKELTKPKKVTRLGTVIDPIDKSEMFKKQKILEKKREEKRELRNQGNRRQAEKKGGK